MGEIVLTDKSQVPTDETLYKILGKSAKVLRQIRAHISVNHGTATPDWKFYSAKYGWTLKTLLKKRNLFFITPYTDYFGITFIFGDKAVAVVEKSDVPEQVIQDLVNAKKYAEGRGIGFEIRDDEHLATLKTLIDIKIAN